MYALEGFAELDIGELVEGVEIGADSTREEDWVLGDDGESSTEIMELDSGDINPIDDDTTFSGFEEAE